MFSRRRFLQIAAASSGLAITGSDLLSQAVANASPLIRPNGSHGIRHVVILMMENRSFDHFLGWLPGADGRHTMRFVSAVDGNTYPNYPLAPDFQGCGYSDPDHSWEGWLVQHNKGTMNGFLQRPTTPANNPGVKLAAANTFPAGYYTNLNHDGSRKALPDLPVIGALAEQYTTLDRYFCAFAGETFPNRFYQHAGQTDRDHNSEVASQLPTIWTSSPRSPTRRASPPAATTTATRRSSRCGPAPASSQARHSSTRRSSTRFPTPTRPPPRCRPAPRSSRPAGTARCPASATSTPPSTTRARERPPTITRWPTSGSASASSPTPTTPSPTTVTLTTPSSS